MTRDENTPEGGEEQQGSGQRGSEAPSRSEADGTGSTSTPPAEEGYADRVFRSPAGMVGGGVLLALVLWLGIDALVNGTQRSPWFALAGLVFVVPLVVAFTLRPAVFAGAERMVVRNPFRTITVPWAAVESLRSGYSSEVVAAGRTFQLWSIPVSLRARNKANRHNERVAAGRPTTTGGGLFGGRAVRAVGPEDTTTRRAPSDQAIGELRTLAEKDTERRERGAKGKAAEQPSAQVRVRWAYEVLVPGALGLVALVVLFATR